MVFQAIGPSDRHITKQERDQNLSSLRGVSSATATAIQNWSPQHASLRAVRLWLSDEDGWRCDIVVCFLVLMMWDMIAWLEGRAGIGMVRYTPLAGAVEAFQCMDG